MQRIDLSPITTKIWLDILRTLICQFALHKTSPDVIDWSWNQNYLIVGNQFLSLVQFHPKGFLIYKIPTIQRHYILHKITRNLSRAETNYCIWNLSAEKNEITFLYFTYDSYITFLVLHLQVWTSYNLKIWIYGSVETKIMYVIDFYYSSSTEVIIYNYIQGSV